VKYLEGISDADIIDLNIPTGVPMVQELDANLKSIRRAYLGDAAKIEQAIHGVAAQGTAR